MGQSAPHQLGHAASLRGESALPRGSCIIKKFQFAPVSKANISTCRVLDAGCGPCLLGRGAGQVRSKEMEVPTALVRWRSEQQEEGKGEWEGGSGRQSPASLATWRALLRGGTWPWPLLPDACAQSLPSGSLGSSVSLIHSLSGQEDSLSLSS